MSMNSKFGSNQSQDELKPASVALGTGKLTTKSLRSLRSQSLKETEERVGGLFVATAVPQNGPMGVAVVSLRAFVS
jgi:hypothetical protein